MAAVAVGVAVAVDPREAREGMSTIAPYAANRIHPTDRSPPSSEQTATVEASNLAVTARVKDVSTHWFRPRSALKRHLDVIRAERQWWL